MNEDMTRGRNSTNDFNSLVAKEKHTEKYLSNANKLELLKTARSGNVPNFNEIVWQKHDAQGTLDAPTSQLNGALEHKNKVNSLGSHKMSI